MTYVRFATGVLVIVFSLTRLRQNLYYLQAVLTFFGKEVILAVPSAKDLGLLFDPNLSFGPHVVKTTSLCTSSLGQINRAKHALDRDLLITVIQSLVYI